jgi:hypothetical protein
MVWLPAFYFKSLHKYLTMKQLLFCCLILAVFSSCDQRTGSGNIITERRQTGNFTGIEVGGAFEVEIKTGPVTEVVVESDDNIIKYIETNVSGNVLEIKTNHSMGFNNAHYKVFITAPAINSIEASGAANIKAKDQLKSSDKISFDISGAAEVNASVDAPEVEVEISGAGNMELGGRTRSYKAKVTGSGDLKAADLLSENADVDVSGAGSAKVHASVSLKAEASGAGNISYKGGASVQQKTSGAGTIKSDN